MSKMMHFLNVEGPNGRVNICLRLKIPGLGMNVCTCDGEPQTLKAKLRIGVGPMIQQHLRHPGVRRKGSHMQRIAALLSVVGFRV